MSQKILKENLKEKKIAVYCAASDEIDNLYIEEGYNLGKAIANNGAALVWGAGSTGVMGAVARGCSDFRGKTIGVAPHFMKDFEPLFKCSVLIQTDDMSERKNIMEAEADAFIIAPGGSGTMDELFQVLCLKQLKRHEKPIILLNTNGFYNGLVAWLGDLCARRFIREDLKDLLIVAETIDSAMAALATEFGKK